MRYPNETLEVGLASITNERLLQVLLWRPSSRRSQESTLVVEFHLNEGKQGSDSPMILYRILIRSESIPKPTASPYFSLSTSRLELWSKRSLQEGQSWDKYSCRGVLATRRPSLNADEARSSRIFVQQHRLYSSRIFEH